MTIIPCFDKRVAIYAVPANGEIIQLVSWFLRPVPFDKNKKGNADLAFRITVAPSKPVPYDLVLSLIKQYGEGIYDWVANPNNATYRESVDRLDAWKIFHRYLNNAWGEYFPNNLEVISINEHLNNHETYKLLLNFFLNFKNSILNEDLHKKFFFPFTEPNE